MVQILILYGSVIAYRYEGLTQSIVKFCRAMTTIRLATNLKNSLFFAKIFYFRGHIFASLCEVLCETMCTPLRNCYCTCSSPNLTESYKISPYLMELHQISSNLTITKCQRDNVMRDNITGPGGWGLGTCFFSKKKRHIYSKLNDILHA